MEYGLTDPYDFTHISNQDLDHHVTHIKKFLPDAVQSIGGLENRGIHVSFSTVQESLTRVDPNATAQRWATPISCQSYSVSGPNAIGHMDGSHKLVR